MKFSQMEYQRPDLTALKAQIQALTKELQAAESYEAAKAVFLKKEELEKHISTQSTLAEIRTPSTPGTSSTTARFASGTVRSPSWRKTCKSGPWQCWPLPSGRILPRNTAT